MLPEAGYRQLRDRAFALVKDGEPVSEDRLLAHVYGGVPPAALRAQLLAPLSDDPRLARAADGTWTVAGDSEGVDSAEFTALALTVTGPNPARARVLRVAALHVAGEGRVERFTATVNPGVRVPRYVAERAGLEPAALDDLPGFDSIVDDLVRFLGERPICAQEADRAWAFLDAEARRAGRTLRVPVLVDVNRLAEPVLESKPNLALIARRFGVGFTRIDHADEEARVISLIVPLLRREDGSSRVDAALGPLQRSATARDLPDRPGIYVMRNEQAAAVYVGKARRLRERVAAYVHRPLGATRRLEGLAGAVQAVDTLETQTDLEALILEDREIRRLQPRFNTVRQQRGVRLWIRMPPWPSKPHLAAPRLELARGSEVGPGEYVGPFRNEMLADQARKLARAVFALDSLRHADVQCYVKILPRAWLFLNGDIDEALDLARAGHAQAVAHGDLRNARVWEQRLALVRDYVPSALLLPADPRCARYAVVRGREAFILDHAVLVGWGELARDEDEDVFARALLEQRQPRTTEAEVDVVLRWFGAQRVGAALIHLPDDHLEAVDRLVDALLLD